MKKKTKKSIKWAVVLLIVAVLGDWVASRWSVWFHNSPEEAWTVPSTPCHVLLTFGNANELSRNISWQCDTVLKNAYVELAVLPDSLHTDTADTTQVEATGEVWRSRNGVAAYYVARLRQLERGKRYAYRAVTGDKASPWYRFEMPDNTDQQVSFLYVGDVQDTLHGEANRFLREALARHQDCKFLVCGGDLTERPANQWWNESFRNLDNVGQHIPILNVTGNHDYLKGVIMKLERRFSLVFSYFLDSKIEDNQLYTLNYGNLQFFLLDSNRELPYLLTQREWLEKQLKESKARWKIVVLHHPLFSIKGNNNLIQRWVFNDLIEQYNVDLVLQGHEHAYARMTRHNGQQATTPVYTVSHCSPKNYRIEFNDRFDKFGISSRYYQTVYVHGDTLEMGTYEVYGHTLYDSLNIMKNSGKDSPRIEDYGKDIPEYLEFTPDAGNKKDEAFARRIEERKKMKGERLTPHFHPTR